MAVICVFERDVRKEQAKQQQKPQYQWQHPQNSGKHHKLDCISTVSSVFHCISTNLTNRMLSLKLTNSQEQPTYVFIFPMFFFAPFVISLADLHPLT